MPLIVKMHENHFHWTHQKRLEVRSGRAGNIRLIDVCLLSWFLKYFTPTKHSIRRLEWLYCNWKYSIELNKVLRIKSYLSKKVQSFISTMQSKYQSSDWPEDAQAAPADCLLKPAEQFTDSISCCFPLISAHSSSSLVYRYLQLWMKVRGRWSSLLNMESQQCHEGHTKQDVFTSLTFTWSPDRS